MKNFKLDKKNIEDILPLTPLQQGMLFHYINNPSSKQYFEQLSLSLSGIWNADAFKKAWNFVADSNESLRSIFRWSKLEKPLQIILKSKEIQIREFDISHLNNFEIHSKLNEIKIKDREENIDISLEPFRVTICKIAVDKCEMIISNHHIIYDGWSSGIILKEFLQVYDQYCNNQEPYLPAKNKFKEFIKWCQEQDKNEQEKYWRNYLDGFSTSTPIAGSYIMQNDNMEVENYVCILSDEVTNSVKKYVLENGLTVASLLYSAWGILLQKYNNKDDVVFGTTVSGRNAGVKGIDNITGMFINTLPLRIKCESSEKVIELIRKVEKDIRERSDYEITSLVDINSYSEIGSNAPLFDSVVVIENYPLDERLTTNNSSLKINSYSIFEMTNFNLALGIIDHGNIELKLIYNTEIFNSETIKRISEHFRNIISEIVMENDKCINEIDMLSTDERENILLDFNNTKRDYPKDSTIHELFEKQVLSVPENYAVICGNKKITYKELNEKSNKLARTLRNKGVKKENIVAVITERSIDMVVAILAILKSGGAYLPIDHNYPQERIKYILSDSNAHLILTHFDFCENISFDGEILNLNDDETYDKKYSNLDNISSATDLAYIIYTSGSTGKPKGVMVEHRSLINFLFSMYSSFQKDISKDDKCLSLTNISFDVSVCEMFLPLSFGASLVFLKIDEMIDVVTLSKTIIDKEISFAYIPPTLLSEVYDLLIENKSKIHLNKMLVGVEPIKDKVLEKYINLNSSMKIINGYGPTEATICATFYKYKSGNITGEIVPIGKPLSNSKIHILDQHNFLVPVGVIGELCILGDGLARGYLNKPELTMEKFVGNTFKHGERMYRTGDLARWTSDGNIEFIGRKDYQVKIRGHRIEIGEIETCLAKYEAVKEAVVIANEDDDNNKYLCAYIVTDNNVEDSELSEHLEEHLPYYMIPQYFVCIDKLPLTSNGKIDRKALPIPQKIKSDKTEYIMPSNEVEGMMCNIWKEVLGVSVVGINNNFFEMGGHSLKAILLASKIYKEFNVDISVKEIFKMPTIKELAEYVIRVDKKEYMPIPLAKRMDYYPVSPSQKRMFLLWQYEDKSTVYNMSGAFIIKGIIDEKKLEHAFNIIIKNHESLRTSFNIVDEQIVQYINNEVDFKINKIDGDIDNIEDTIDNFIKPFELENAPLIRVGLAELEKEKHLLLIDLHHIISDGVSVQILIAELAKIMENKELIENRIQYKDFVLWQQENIKRISLEKQKEYWLKVFNEEVPLLDIPSDFSRPLIKSNKGSSIKFKISKELTEKLNKFAQKEDTTLFVVLFSVFNIMLSKYSGQEDIVVGTPVAGRSHNDLQNIIGMFVKTLAIRNYPKGNASFKEFIADVKQNVLSSLENQDYEFENLVEELKLTRDLSRNPIFDIMFVLQNINDKEINIRDLEFESYYMKKKMTKFDITLIACESNGEIEFELEYCEELFLEERMYRMVEHYINLLNNSIENSDNCLCNLDMLSQVEKEKLLFEFNQTRNINIYDNTICLHELFEKKVEETPDNIALIFGEESITYRELNNRANQIAALLRSKGAAKNSIVGLMVERSLEMIVGIFGILKSGAAYMPIDTEYPIDRIKYMIEDSKSSILVTKGELGKDINLNIEIVNLDNPEIYTYDSANTEIINKADDLIYVIYTSGSTGMPKGVMVQHKSVSNIIQVLQNRYQLGRQDSYLLKTTYTFDVSVSEIFGWFLDGGKLVILEEQGHKNPKIIIDAINKYKITHLNFVPSMLNAFLDVLASENIDTLDSLRYVFSAGEAISSDIVSKFYSLLNNTKLENLYGPTEATIYSTGYSIDKLNQKALIPIGKPLQNIEAYILDKYNNIQPIGVPGELYISGICLAKGYLNREQLTNEKFVPNPFVEGNRMYSTGDLSRWLPDGNIEYLGRIDHQVKVRGFRIELGEIEAQLQSHEKINTAVVVVRTGSDNIQYLCAYVTTEEEFDLTEIRSYLSQKLPYYMIPDYFVKMDVMPLTSSGKINKKALPEPYNKSLRSCKYIEPTNSTESKLVELWEQVLDFEKVGIDDNFFEIGGHSLKATLLLSKICSTFDVNMPFIEIFKLPTIREQAVYLMNSEYNKANKITPIEEQEYYQVSSAQKRIFIVDKIKEKDTSYNMFGAVIIKGSLDKKRLEDAFNNLVRRHETLRTRFCMINNEPVQIIEKEIDFKISHLESSENNLDEIIDNFVKPFDLEKAPLLRIGLVRINEIKHAILIDMHHIISDGVSINVLIKDFINLYEDSELDELKIQYKDYSAWQNNYLKSSVVKKQEEYWWKKLDGFLYTEINRKNTSVKQKAVALRKVLILDKEDMCKIDKFCKKNKITKFIFMLGIFKIVLFNETHESDLTVGIPIAGRHLSGLENLIGVFLNVLLIRTKIKEDATINEYLEAVKETVIEAQNNQDYPYEELYYEMKNKHDIKMESLFSILFNYLPYQGYEEAGISGLSISHYEIKKVEPKYDISIYVNEKKENIELKLVYKENLYEEYIIDRILSNYKHLINKVISNSEIKIGECNFSNDNIIKSLGFQIEDFSENEDFFDD